MTLLQIVILSLIQGLSEFLPISSSAHLILPSKILGWQDQGLAMDVACHFGSLLAIIIYYFKDLYSITLAWFGHVFKRVKSTQANIGWFLILATIPVCLAGLLLNNIIESTIRDYAILVIAITTIVFGALLWVADIVSNKKAENIDDDSSLSFKKALFIGLSQIIALIPGTSRSGITITTGLFCGLSRREAARFSFLLSVPVIIAATSYSTFKLIENSIQDNFDINILYFALAIFLSFISAYVVIVFFMKFIQKIGMLPFVFYRFLLGILLLCVYFI